MAGGAALAAGLAAAGAGWGWALAGYAVGGPALLVLAALVRAVPSRRLALRAARSRPPRFRVAPGRAFALPRPYPRPPRPRPDRSPAHG
ncbi:MAG: hypothetical protein VYD87_10725 [Pseudomonadota bacterium]|nr:hypothetical protein [Pseudomonadota bacterium]